LQPVIKPRLKGSFTCPKVGTRDRLFNFPSEGRRAEDYLYSKNPKASAGCFFNSIFRLYSSSLQPHYWTESFEPANSGTRGQHANHLTTEASCIWLDVNVTMDITMLLWTSPCYKIYINVIVSYLNMFSIYQCFVRRDGGDMNAETCSRDGICIVVYT
jgi:hypothetical protein